MVHAMSGVTSLKNRKAFTLVELLIVVGIIALLIAILMPVMAKAREAEQRASCLSNLRQIHHAFHYYAMDNHDQVPLGYRQGKKQFNSMIFSGTIVPPRFVLFGLLYPVNLMHEPRVFFCPSETDDRSMINTSTNPWPPGPDGDPTKNVSAGYCARPVSDLPDDPAQWTTNTFPRLTKLRDEAIFADLMGLPMRVDTRHRTGINVLYGDGSAHWVARSTFDAQLAPCTSVSGIYNPNQDQIWGILDAN
jgi:prepilin-type N-terminal cleavage/methylation domain-containing protein/prepilin-type processing-associated H-X9-DG protein